MLFLFFVSFGFFHLLCVNVVQGLECFCRFSNENRERKTQKREFPGQVFCEHIVPGGVR